MTLTGVVYEFFEFEEPLPAATELRRQLKLVFADAPPLYVSWTWAQQRGVDSEPYSVATSETSFFSDSPAVQLDASAGADWSIHVGRGVEVGPLMRVPPLPENQTLEVRSDGGRTFVSSFGRDHLSVSRAMPAPEP